MLTAEGFEVLIAIDGLEAIEIARREHPNLLLIDIDIAGLDGYEVTTRLKASPSFEDTPVVAVTAATSEGDRQRARVAGCTGYIAKPIDVDRFPDQVRSYFVGMREAIAPAEQHESYLAEYNKRLARRLEEKVRELQRAQQELQRVDKMKSDFVVLAGHELRTPLTVIHGYLQILRANPDIPGSPEIQGSPKHLLMKVADAVERLDNIVQDLLNVSLIDADRLELAHEPVFPHSLIYSILHHLQSFGPRMRKGCLGLLCTSCCPFPMDTCRSMARRLLVEASMVKCNSYGGCGLMVKAPVCGTGDCGFESHHPPSGNRVRSPNLITNFAQVPVAQ